PSNGSRGSCHQGLGHKFAWGVGGVVWHYSDGVRCTVGLCGEDGRIGKLGGKGCCYFVRAVV
nr:hypothetical protein [Tanacetum cinerariifolium]